MTNNKFQLSVAGILAVGMLAAGSARAADFAATAALKQASVTQGLAKLR